MSVSIPEERSSFNKHAFVIVIEKSSVLLIRFVIRGLSSSFKLNVTEEVGVTGRT
jgi:hypothetical protein